VTWIGDLSAFTVALGGCININHVFMTSDDSYCFRIFRIRPLVLCLLFCVMDFLALLFLGTVQCGVHSF
jgi:hypothetical protein